MEAGRAMTEPRKNRSLDCYPTVDMAILVLSLGKMHCSVRKRWNNACLEQMRRYYSTHVVWETENRRVGFEHAFPARVGVFALCFRR